MVAHLDFKLLHAVPAAEVKHIVAHHASLVLFKTHRQLLDEIDIESWHFLEGLKTFDFFDSEALENLRDPKIGLLENFEIVGGVKPNLAQIDDEIQTLVLSILLDVDSSWGKPCLLLTVQDGSQLVPFRALDHIPSKFWKIKTETVSYFGKIRETQFEIFKIERWFLDDGHSFDAELAPTRHDIWVLGDKGTSVSFWQLWDGLNVILSGQESVDDRPGVNWYTHE